MKKFSIVALLLILFAADSKPQGLYSKKNLERAFVEDLSLYLKKAQKQKKKNRWSNHYYRFFDFNRWWSLDSY